MQDERNTPQDEDAEDVEAHLRAHGRSDEDEDSDDEVEAHTRRPASPETRAHEPSE